MEKVVLVNDNNEVIGFADKSKIHTEKTPLHRGFSLFLFNPKNGKLLLQQRSHFKKTFPLIWSNSCCGHPKQGEDNIRAAVRRLNFELGIKNAEIFEVIKNFRYHAEMNGVQENEICPILVGFSPETPKINNLEVENIKWISWPKFKEKIIKFPEEYSLWSVEEAKKLERCEYFHELIEKNMTSSSKLLNYFGQFRIYSFLDLVLLLIAARANRYQFVGGLFLWLAFIVYLECRHRHQFRLKFPDWLWIVLGLVGLFFYHNLGTIGFLVFSFLYTLKDKKWFGSLAPFFRGLQNFFLIAGITGFRNFLPWLAFVLITIRNLSADFRDVEKDIGVDMKTAPVLLGFKKDIRYVHLVIMMITSFIWWYLGGIGVQYLLVVWTVQALSYNLTPR